jgi:tetratricopeptide (TPR) repeat protein
LPPIAFFEHLKDIATSPLAFAAYVVLIGAWVYVAVAQQRLHEISQIITKLPENDRAAILVKEYNTTPRHGLSAGEWIKARKQMLVLVAFLATLVTAVVIFAIASFTHPNPGGIDADAKAEVRNLIATGYFEPALKKARLLVAKEPQDPETFRLEGIVHYKLGEYKSALDDYQESLKLDPSSSATLLCKAEALVETHDFGQARTILANLRQADPEDHSILYDLAAVDLVQGNYDIAKSEFVQLYESAGDAGRAADALGLGLAEILSESSGSESETGIKHLREAVCRDPHLRGIFDGTLRYDTNGTYTEFLVTLQRASGSSGYNAFLEDLREGKTC